MTTNDNPNPAEPLIAGRKLDFEIALKFGDEYLHSDGSLSYATIPNFSTDIAAAWELAEYMIKNIVTWISVSSTGGAWTCHFEVKSRKNPNVSYGNGIRADTAALAICKAFLDLKLKEEE